jgi:iron complex outermembrane receptor protein
MRSFGVGLLTTACVLAGGPAPAQDRADAAPPQKVEITGSRIPRLLAETALPVQIITRQDVAQSGAQSVAELLERVVAASGGWNEAQSVGNPERAGYAGISLRGLGTKSTLVLLNGRRVANAAFSSGTDSGVDLHMIPLAALDRVEVLKDGASAIYGSDAIGGVVNFILRTDYSGAEVNASRTWSEQGGGGRRRAGIAGGTGSLAEDGYNVFAVLDHTRAERLVGEQRSYASSSNRPDYPFIALSQASFPANVQLGGQRFTSPVAADCPTPTTVARNGGCFFDAAPLRDLLPQLEHTSLFAAGTLQLQSDWQARVELAASRHRQPIRYSPTPVSNQTNSLGQPLVIRPSSPYYPVQLGLTGDLKLAYRTTSLGPRTNLALADQGRVLAGARGTLGDWSLDAAAALSKSRGTDTYVSGFVSAPLLIDAVRNGLVNPFGPSDAAGEAAFQATQLRGLARRAEGTTRSIDARASRELTRWDAGTVSLALGTEWRDERIDDLTTSLATDVAGGSYRAPKSGARKVQVLFAELLTPLTRTLEMQWALRADHYSDFGSTTNPKVALRWQPQAQWLVRASAGSGFRAPSLPELYTAQTTQVSGPSLSSPDPLRCPTTKLDSDCIPTWTALSGGNPALVAERSRQWSVGAGFEPVRGASVTLDFWSIDLRNTIASVDDIVFGDPAFEGRYIVRGPVQSAYPGLPGPILSTIGINQNLGRKLTRGWDLAARWSGPAPWGGRLNLRLDGTYVDTARFASNGVDEQSVVAQYVLSDSIPRWSHNIGLGWSTVRTNVELVQVLRGRYLGPETNFSERHPVAPYLRWDLNAGHDVLSSALGTLRLMLGVRNLADRDPPLVFGGSLVGYDPAYADPRGRTWAAGLRWQWR